MMAMELVKQAYKPGRGQRLDVMVDGVKAGEVRFLPPIKGFPFTMWSAYVDGQPLGQAVDTRLEAVAKVMLAAGHGVQADVA